MGGDVSKVFELARQVPRLVWVGLEVARGHLTVPP
jgi:hypothetical protein